MIRGAAWFVVLVFGASTAWAQGFPAPELKTFREVRGLSAPSWDPALALTCAARAEALGASGKLSHQDPQGRGPGAQLLAQGFPPGEYGEILGAGADPGAVWSAWLASRAHRDVLSTPGWVTWGAAGVPRGTTKVWVVRFYRP